jgi:hypothetical protein
MAVEKLRKWLCDKSDYFRHDNPLLYEDLAFILEEIDALRNELRHELLRHPR